jgi:hypothetical protein
MAKTLLANFTFDFTFIDKNFIYTIIIFYIIFYHDIPL